MYFFLKSFRLTTLKKFPLNRVGRRCAVTTSSISETDFASARPYEEIPKIRSFPFVRSTWVYFPIIGKYNKFRLQDTDLKKYREYGKIIREDVGLGNELLLLYDPNDIEKMYRFEGRFPSRTTFKTVELYKKQNKDHYLNGLFSSAGQTWHDSRSKLQKYISKPELVSVYLPEVNGMCEHFVENITRLTDSNGEIGNLLQELNKFSMEFVGLYALDKSLGCLRPEVTDDDEAMKVLNGLGVFFSRLTDLEFGPEFQYKYFPTKKWREYSGALNTFHRFAKKHIDESLERISKRGENERSSMTLLETFLKIEKMDQVLAITTVNDMLLAGTLSTSHTLAYALYQIASNPEAQNKAYEEVLQHLPEMSSQVTSSHLNEMKYMKACVKESMRVMPIIAFNRRQLPQDVVLSGYRVPAGTICVAQALALTLMEENFPEPKKFKPERWLSDQRKESHPFAFLPFGFGPRNCVGRRMTEQAMWTLVAKMLRNYKMEYHYEGIDLITKFIHQPDKPLKIKFIRRSK